MATEPRNGDRFRHIATGEVMTLKEWHLPGHPYPRGVARLIGAVQLDGIRAGKLLPFVRFCNEWAPVEGKEIDTPRTASPTCPHCGDASIDGCDIMSDESEAICDACGKPFVITRHVEVSYTTNPMEGEDGN